MFEKTQSYFFFALFLIVAIVAFFMVLPFLQALVLAAAFAVVFRGFFLRISRSLGGRDRIAALLTIVLVGLIIFVPLTFIGTQVVRESSAFYEELSTGSEGGVLDVLIEKVDRLPLPQDFDLRETLKGMAANIVRSSGSLFAGTVSFFATFLLSLFVGILALYYFLVDGSAFKQGIKKFSPLPDSYDETILKHLAMTMNSVLRGSLVVAVAQGIVAGIGFAIFGVPHAALWGTLTAVSALIPGIGTAIIVLPAAIFLFAIGATGPGIGLLIWGVLAVGLIDNVIRPMLIKSGVRVHPLAVFISVLGGITVFGPLGFLIGPIVMSLFFTLLSIYGSLLGGESSSA